MTTEGKDPGRLKGGLLHALRSERAKGLYWAAAEGAVGFGVGLLFVTLYLAYR